MNNDNFDITQNPRWPALQAAGDVLHKAGTDMGAWRATPHWNRAEDMIARDEFIGVVDDILRAAARGQSGEKSAAKVLYNIGRHHGWWHGRDFDTLAPQLEKAATLMLAAYLDNVKSPKPGAGTPRPLP